MKSIEKTSKRTHLGLSLLLLLSLSFSIYSPALQNQFTNFDDNRYVTQNDRIKSVDSVSIQALFSKFVVGHHAYTPLTFLTYAIEYHFFGIDPFIYILDNILLHLLNIALVFWLIFILTNSLLPTVIVTSIFATHPMNVESVVWIAERKSLLCSFFYLAGLISYTTIHLQNKIPKKNPLPIKTSSFLNFITVLFFFASLLSKPAGITFPLSLLAIDYYFKKSFHITDFFKKIPLLAIGITLGIATTIQINILNPNLLSIQTDFSLTQKVLLSLQAFILYLIKFILPIHLSILYPYPPITHGWLPLNYYLSPLLLILLFYLIIKKPKHPKEIIFGFLFFLSTIVIVLIPIPHANSYMADRYTYLPFIGLSFIVAHLYTQSSHKKILNIAGILIIVLFSFLTTQRSVVWKNDISLWSDTIEKYPNIALAYDSRGIGLKQKNYPMLALVDFTKAITLAPNNPLYLANRGNIYNDLEQYSKALDDYNKALEINPNLSQIYNSRGIVYAKMKNYAVALENFDKSIELKPNSAGAYINRGTLYFHRRQYDSALKNYNQALLIDPQSNAARSALRILNQL